MNHQNKTSSEVHKIQNVLSKGTQSKPQHSDDALNYSFDEKCTAIFNWANKTDVKFDTSVVESIHANATRYGKPTHNQMRAINNIITKFKINVVEWSY